MTIAERRRAMLSRAFRWRIVGCVLLGLAVGVTCWFFGVDVAHAVGIGAVAVAFAGSVALVSDQARVDWSPAPVLPRDGARREIVQLGRALNGRSGSVAPEAVRRLRTLTAQVLELHGLDLDESADRQAIERALGPEVLHVIRPGTAETPRMGVYVSALSVLDRLTDAPPGSLTPTSTMTDTTIDTTTDTEENFDAR